MRYIISYDISNDKRRRKVFKILEGVGFRVQYSVFEADLNRTQFTTLKKRLKGHVRPKSTDSIRYYPLDKEAVQKVEVVGQDMSRTLGGLLIV